MNCVLCKEDGTLARYTERGHFSTESFRAVINFSVPPVDDPEDICVTSKFISPHVNDLL